ncbi:MAG TPA: hypothetical protein ENH85_07095 [Candidatus Scalindua sp.]|nr:hypothetical protein [Candidatus Scalindua sp.]
MLSIWEIYRMQCEIDPDEDLKESVDTEELRRRLERGKVRAHPIEKVSPWASIPGCFKGSLPHSNLF